MPEHGPAEIAGIPIADSLLEQLRANATIEPVLVDDDGTPRHDRETLPRPVPQDRAGGAATRSRLSDLRPPPPTPDPSPPTPLLGRHRRDLRPGRGVHHLPPRPRPPRPLRPRRQPQPARRPPQGPPRRPHPPTTPTDRPPTTPRRTARRMTAAVRSRAMSVDVLPVPYGEPAARALFDAVVAAKGGDPLAPVTVVVPTNYVGVAARRLLGARDARAGHARRRRRRGSDVPHRVPAGRAAGCTPPRGRAPAPGVHPGARRGRARGVGDGTGDLRPGRRPPRDRGRARRRLPRAGGDRRRRARCARAHGAARRRRRADHATGAGRARRPSGTTSAT